MVDAKKIVVAGIVAGVAYWLMPFAGVAVPTAGLAVVGVAIAGAVGSGVAGAVKI